MASNVVTFSLDNFCAALAHGDLKMFLDGDLISQKVIHWEGEKEVPTNEELKDVLFLLVREMIKRSGADTKADVNSVIPQLSITLDYPVIP